MKRWHWLGLLGALLLGGMLALNTKAMDPADFTGIWYYAEDGSRYLFHNGIILSEKHHLDITEDEIISGAYQFGSKQIFLFFLDQNGVQREHSLTLATGSAGDNLCDSATGKAIFYRSKDGVGSSKNKQERG